MNLPKTDEEWREAYLAIRHINEFERSIWWNGFAAGGMVISMATIVFIWFVRLIGY